MTGQIIRVLVIDDDEDDFFMLRGLLGDLKHKKFQVDWAHSYEDGKAKLREKKHDVCFLDYRLGAKTGLDILKELSLEAFKTPIILLTGYGELETDLEAMRLGAADYLVKDQVTPLLLERSIRYSIHRTQAIQAILEREAKIVMQDRLASIGLLASSLAHEIGTPLGVIRGRAEYLDMQVGDDPAVKKNVEIIISQIDRVSKLIRSLLNLARGDKRKQAEKISLNEAISEVLELMAHEFRTHQIVISNNFESTGDIFLSAEAGPLRQIFLNLFVNSVYAIESAVKAGRNEGHFIKISVREQGNYWAISVLDSGCGISEENLKNLFKPFFTTKDIGVGTGLGLATSYGIVESWGGSISVTSTEGKETEFVLLLPKA